MTDVEARRFEYLVCPESGWLSMTVLIKNLNQAFTPPYRQAKDCVICTRGMLLPRS